MILPMMAALYGLGFANIFLRSTMGVLAPELSRELALTPEMLGAIASAYFVSYALMQIPTGVLLDRFGPWRTVSAMFLLTVIGTYLFAIAPSGTVMLIARLLMGAGCAGVFAGAFMVIARFFAHERFTSIGGTLNSFAMLGTFAATVPLAVLVALLGWRVSFAAIALGMGLIALLAVSTVRDWPSGARPAARVDHGMRPGAILAGSLEVLRTPGILPLASGGIALSAGNTLLGIWGGPYLNDVHGLDELARGKVLSAMALSGVAGHFLYGHAARWLNTLKGLVIGGSVGITAVMATLALLPEPGVLTVTVLLAVLGLACSFPTILLAHARALVPDHLIGRGLTTVNTGIMIAIALMQLSVGAIIGWVGHGEAGEVAEHAYRTAFGFIALMAFLSSLVYMRVKDARPR